jgi:hypothetical protein
MEFVQDEIHDSLRAYFQSIDVARLSRVLIDSGVADEAVRRKVLENYFFEAGHFLDAEWFEMEGKRFAPGIYFEEIGTAGERSGKCYLPDPNLGTLFHEFAHGTVDVLLDPESGVSFDITTGQVGE